LDGLGFVGSELMLSVSLGTIPVDMEKLYTVAESKEVLGYSVVAIQPSCTKVHAAFAAHIHTVW